MFGVTFARQNSPVLVSRGRHKAVYVPLLIEQEPADAKVHQYIAAACLAHMWHQKCATIAAFTSLVYWGPSTLYQQVGA